MTKCWRERPASSGKLNSTPLDLPIAMRLPLRGTVLVCPSGLVTRSSRGIAVLLDWNTTYYKRRRLISDIEALASRLQARFLPQLIDPALHLRGHCDDVRPGPGEAFTGPFAGCVDPHFRTVVGQAAGVVERIDRPHDKLDIALRVDVIERLPG